MKIVRIETESLPQWGVLDDDIVRTSSTPVSVDQLAVAVLDHERPQADVRFEAPVTSHAKILCVGLNYRDHVIEMGRELPQKPVLFTRFADSLVGPQDALIMPGESERFDYEGEFAVVIGRTGRRIAEADALDHVLGYTIVNDGSIRDFQRHTIQFTPGKNFDDSGAVGPWIVTRDEFGPIGAQRVRTSVNGEVRQESTLDQLVFGVPALIAYISQWTTLRPGDIIATGTPGGVADGAERPRWMRAGDVVRVEIDGLGALENSVKADTRQGA